MKFVSREQLLDSLAEVYFLRRILRDLSRSDQHVITLELLPLGQWRQDGRLRLPAVRSGSVTPTRALARRAGELRGPLPRRRLASREAPRELPNLLYASLEPVHVALKLVGPGVRPFFEGEAGLHVWQSTGRLPEIVKVRVHAEAAPEPLELITQHEAKLQAFHKARQAGREPTAGEPRGRRARGPRLPLRASHAPGRGLARWSWTTTCSPTAGTHRVRTPAERPCPPSGGCG